MTKPLILAFAILWGLLSFGIAGHWDYQDEMECHTDMECQQKYGGEGYGN